MTITDIVLLIIFGIVCFCSGKAYMLYSIEKTSVKNVDYQEHTIGNLFLEKVDSIYYAYIENKFVGQSANLDELFLNMKDIHNITTFNIDTISGLTQDDYNLVIQSIEKMYTVV